MLLVDQVGVSVPSEVAHVKTPNTTALAPGVPKVIGSNRASVSLSWTPPEEDGGSPVTSYEVEMEPKSRAAIDGGMDKEYVTVYQVCSSSPFLSCPQNVARKLSRHLHVRIGGVRWFAAVAS